MPPKQRQIRIEQKSALAAMQRLETHSDDELLAETKYRAAAQAILGARSAEKYDAKAARVHFQKAIAAARPQERMQLRRMAEASLALAERRPSDLKEAVEKLGHEAPSSRQLFLLRLMGLIAPAPGASILLRARGILILIALVIGVLALGLGIVELIALPFGGIDVGQGLVLGALLAAATLAIVAVLGRRRQKKAQAERQARAPG
ncbi:MAG TPA: hypothetical protein VHR88_07695 [Solirubrobacteraceae bacterium]|jgi:hypothetical protein|nr:hypothetical protein [Solirubrobacteraceae bacterium]